jgi:hypothetical protein
LDLTAECGIVVVLTIPQASENGSIPVLKRKISILLNFFDHFRNIQLEILIHLMEIHHQYATAKYGKVQFKLKVRSPL